MTTVFSKFDNGRSTEVRVTDDLTWMTLADAFQEFLAGSGFQVTRTDLAEYFSDGEWEQPLDEFTSVETINVGAVGSTIDTIFPAGANGSWHNPDVFTTMASTLTGEK